MDLIPKTSFQKFWNSSFKIDCLAFLITVGASISGWAVNYYDKPPKFLQASVTAASGLGAALLIFLRGSFSYRKEDKSANHKTALKGALHTIYSILTQPANHANLGHATRICIFTRTNDQLVVHQLTDYVSEDAPYGANRDLSCRSGIVGVAFRSGQYEYDKLPANVNLVDHYVAKYGFERKEAGEMRADRKSWAAIPIGKPNAVVAVVYVDSALVNFFGQANSAKRQSLQNAVLGLAKFIDTEQ